jgi:cyclopropane fatty-acyl-phospholipid synthase-like methyltransferase
VVPWSTFYHAFHHNFTTKTPQRTTNIFEKPQQNHQSTTAKKRILCVKSASLASMKILDYGGGSGLFAQHLRDQEFSATTPPEGKIKIPSATPAASPAPSCL